MDKALPVDMAKKIWYNHSIHLKWGGVETARTERYYLRLHEIITDGGVRPPMEYLIHLVLLFFIYSFIGWCTEVTLKYIQYHRFINRGFFTGPICPIYGSGAVLITIAVENLSPYESAYGTTFAISFLLCGLVEYFTSYFMEKRFHARWWDYSNKPMNLHGRIWIGNLILFGLGGVAIIHIINPVLYAALNRISLSVKVIIVCSWLAVFSADYVMTHFVLKLVKIGVESSKADSTEEINREIRMILSDRNIFYRRFAKAYPDVIYTTERINKRISEMKAQTERLRQEIADTLEPSTMIKDTIISKQEELISFCYDEDTATADMKKLKMDIETQKARLYARPLKKIVTTREKDK